MDLYVDADSVMLALGQDPATATVVQTARVQRAIRAAQAKVMAFLGRDELTAKDITLGDQEPHPDAVNLAELAAWPGLPVFDDYAQYVAHAATGDGVYEVTVRVGFDVAGDPRLAPVRAFIETDAIEALTGDSAFPDVQQRVSSLSAGGQSISYEGRATTAEGAGGPITIATLGRFRRFAVGKSTRAPMSTAPWPYARRSPW